jgi:hypothetical protein
MRIKTDLISPAQKQSQFPTVCSVNSAPFKSLTLLWAKSKFTSTVLVIFELRIFCTTFLMLFLMLPSGHVSSFQQSAYLPCVQNISYPYHFYLNKLWQFECKLHILIGSVNHISFGQTECTICYQYNGSRNATDPVGMKWNGVTFVSTWKLPYSPWEVVFIITMFIFSRTGNQYKFASIF